MISTKFIWLCLVIMLFSNGFYLKDTLKGETKPNKVSFLLWGIVPLIAYFSARQAGGGIQTLYSLMAGVFPMIIFLASFRDKGSYWRVSRFDIFCGLISLIALFCLLVSKQPTLSLIFSAISDFSAAIPTIIKCYKYPETETKSAYSLEIVSSVLVVLTIKHWIFASYFFAVYILCMSMMFTLILNFSPNQKTQS